MKRATWIIFTTLIFVRSGFSQDTVFRYQRIVTDTIRAMNALPRDSLNPTVVHAMIINGDTLPVVDLNTAIVFPLVVFNNNRDMVRYDKLVYNVRKVYPYAKIAGAKFNEFKKTMDTIQTEKARKAFIKKAEKELEDKFGDQVRALTFSQGKILIKLIYRQTGNSSYDIVKELRGSFSAFIWQTLAQLFGYDLRTGYDPAGEDQAIERIVLLIDSGAI